MPSSIDHLLDTASIHPMKTAPSEESCLSLRALTKVYRGGTAPANDQITTTLSPGELVGLLGHNGAGKSTLLQQIIGTTKPTEGTISYGSRSLVDDPGLARRVSSMMPQVYAPLMGVTPAQAISSIARLRGLSASAARRATDTLLETLDIAEWKNRPGEKLSGGLRRLTSYAMAVVAPSPILLIDEPTNDVDPARRPLIWQHLRHLARAGHIVVVVTHNLHDVERTADRYILLQQGRILADSTPREFAANRSTSTLTLSLRAPLPDSPLPNSALPDSAPPDSALPPALTVTAPDDAGQVHLSLSPEQVPPAVDWALRHIATGEVATYHLAPSSLESLYHEVTHAR